MYRDVFTFTYDISFQFTACKCVLRIEVQLNRAVNAVGRFNLLQRFFVNQAAERRCVLDVYRYCVAFAQFADCTFRIVFKLCDYCLIIFYLLASLAK